MTSWSSNTAFISNLFVPCSYQLQIGICHGHLPSSSTRIKLCAAAAADFQYPRKGVQGGDQEWGTLCSGSGESGRTDLQIVSMFSRVGLWTQFLYLLMSKIHIKIFHSDEGSSWLAESVMRLAETFWKNLCLIACTPPSPKSYIHWPSPSFLEQFLRAIQGAVSQAAVFILPQVKFNSHVVHFLNQHPYLCEVCVS